MNIELTVVTNELFEDALPEVALDELIFHGVFRVAAKVLKGVDSDFIFLDIRVHKNEAFHFAFDAMSNQFVFQKNLFTKHKSKIALAQQCVQEVVVLA